MEGRGKETVKVNIDEIKFLKEFYPRENFDNETVNAYRLNLDHLPAIVVTKDLVLIDGYHRLLAHKVEGLKEIEAEIIDIPQDRVLWEATKLNARHGFQLGKEDKKRLARIFWDNNHYTLEDIAKVLSVDVTYVSDWTKQQRVQKKEQRDKRIAQLYHEGYSQREIAEKLGIPNTTIESILLALGLKPIDPLELEKLVCSKLNAEHTGKHSNDRGLDGIITNESKGIQVKLGCANRPILDNFVGALARVGLKSGILVASTFTRDLETQKNDFVNQGFNIELAPINKFLPNPDLHENLGIEKIVQKEDQKRILELYLSCTNEGEIAQKLGLEKAFIGSYLLELYGKLEEYRVTPESLQFFNHWHFTNRDPRFGLEGAAGQIPGQIIENVLYYWTQPFDIVVDPMAGGGTAIDVCKLMYRRYQAYDISPLRGDITKWDITLGFPDDAKNCDFVFLDPPYYKKIDNKMTDEAIESLNRTGFMTFIHKLAKDCYRTVKQKGIAALLMSDYINYEKYEDSIFSFEYAQHFEEAGFRTIHHISVPLNTQQRTGFDVLDAKKRKVLLEIARDLFIFRKNGGTT